MCEYNGNAIYDYVVQKKLNFYFSVKDNWMLVYGNSDSIPKIFVFACKVENINISPAEERNNANMAASIANYLRLPFLYVRFASNSNMVSIWESKSQCWNTVSYDELRDIYEEYGVVRPGTAKKAVNQYVSSPYHDWQRQNLGRITVSDFDLLKYRNNQIEEVIELKRSKIDINKWNPYTDDFPNFALIINTIINSGVKIPFTLYYNKMAEGTKGERVEDISKIKVFEFVIPDRMINSNQINYKFCGIFTPDELLF